MSDLDTILGIAPVIPVLVLDRIEDAVPIAQALVEEGLRVVEVTMRTPVALEAIRAIRQVEGAIVGAGTILTPSQFDAALEAGAAFLVSPGLTPALGEHAASSSVPFLPGVATASEIMQALDRGFSRLKFFPAAAAGGPTAIKAHSAVFTGVRFCPTGGITLQTAPDWLALPSVACVGGGWLLPPGSAPDLNAIRERARAASALRDI
jgi:2-dehydro-3-deoxyphosphogluconate aldolase/(4S)-4-hydroxy-2-oxoglutarate aldolase